MKTNSVVTRTGTAKCVTKSTHHSLAGMQCSAEVFKYLNAALSENTLLAYRADLNHFLASGGTIPSKPERVANYIVHFATLHRARKNDVGTAGALTQLADDVFIGIRP